LPHRALKEKRGRIEKGLFGTWVWGSLGGNAGAPG
jgi:hypothetical protein